MIKNINNTEFLSVKIFEDDVNILKDGDVVVWNRLNQRWQAGSIDLAGEINTFFGIVCDTNDKSEYRLICIRGIVEANIEEAAHPENEILFFKADKKEMSFVPVPGILPNAQFLKYLPNKHNKVRGLVHIFNNTNYKVT